MNQQNNHRQININITHTEDGATIAFAIILTIIFVMSLVFDTWGIAVLITAIHASRHISTTWIVWQIIIDILVTIALGIIAWHAIKAAVSISVTENTAIEKESNEI